MSETKMEEARREAHTFCPCRVPVERYCCCRRDDRAPHCRCCHQKTREQPANECKQAYHAAIDRAIAATKLEQAERDVFLLTEKDKGHMMRLLEERDRLWREAGGDDGK